MLSVWEPDCTGLSIADALQLCEVELDFIRPQWFVCRKRAPLSWERPFFLVNVYGASGRVKFPLLHPGKLYSHICANTIFPMCVVSCYICLRFLLQPEEAVPQKFMPVSLQWAQLLNKIDLSAWELQGGQNFGPIYFFIQGVQS